MKNYALPMLLLLTMCLQACATSKQRYVSAPCQEQWEIPPSLSEPAQSPAAIQNLKARSDDLTKLLIARQKPASTTPESSPASKP